MNKWQNYKDFHVHPCGEGFPLNQQLNGLLNLLIYVGFILRFKVWQSSLGDRNG